MRRLVLLAVGLCWFAPGAASQPAIAGPSDPVVVSVGTANLRASELAFHLGRLHELERQSYGKTPDEVRRGVLQRKLIPGLLYAEQARSLGLAAQPDVVDRVQRELVDALKSRLQREADAALTAKEIREYCRAGGGKSAAECDRDHLSYRIALRRTKAHETLTALTQKLQKQHVRSVDRALLERLAISTKGEISASAPTAAQQGKP